MLNNKNNLKSYFIFLEKLIKGNYMSFNKLLWLIFLNHWAMCFWITSINLMFYIFKNIYTNSSLIFLISCFGLIINLTIKIISPFYIFSQVTNIKKKLKFFIFFESFLNPFGIAITLYKMYDCNIYFWKRIKPDFIVRKTKYFQKQPFPKKIEKYFLKIKNLSFMYHDDYGIKKIYHFFLKKINKNLFKNHMRKMNHKHHDNLENQNFSILQNINLNFTKHKFIAILGKNGCGKTTLIKIINNLIERYSGEIMWGGTNAKKINIKSFAQNISFVTQESIIYNNITVWEFVNHAFHPYPYKVQNILKNKQNVAIEYLKEFGLLQYKDNFLFNLSGGIKKKVIIAKALMQLPKFIFLDEPTTYLDIKNQYLVLNILKKMQKKNKLTVVAILHNLQEVKNFADEVIIVDNGSVFLHEKTEIALSPENIKEIFE